VLIVLWNLDSKIWFLDQLLELYSWLVSDYNTWYLNMKLIRFGEAGKEKAGIQMIKWNKSRRSALRGLGMRTFLPKTFGKIGKKAWKQIRKFKNQSSKMLDRITDCTCFKSICIVELLKQRRKQEWQYRRSNHFMKAHFLHLGTIWSILIQRTQFKTELGSKN